MIRQSLALLLDAYRDLNSRRMFWIVLILSGLVAASFVTVGLHPTGFDIFFFWKIQSKVFNSSMVDPAQLYKQIFLIWGVYIYLTFIATILALICTASIFPDFLATGAIDLYLSKPIGRLRLFLTKYICALLFVALQLLSFCVASYFVLGIRGGVWEAGIFYAVPIVLVFFSYLFCVCVFIGITTRSTVAAILLTILFWLGVWGLHVAEGFFLVSKLGEQDTAHRIDSEIANSESALARAKEVAATRPTTRNSEAITKLQSQLDIQRSKRADVGTAAATWQQILFEAKTLLPKTSETVALLERRLVISAHLQREANNADDSTDYQRDFNGDFVSTKEIQAEYQKRSVGWVVGTSLGFEVVVLGIAAWLFCRRDY